VRLLPTKEESRRAVRPHRNGPRDSRTLSHAIPYSSIIWPFFGQDCWRMVDSTDSRSSPSDDIGPKRETPMNSTPTPKAIEPHNDLIARADEQLAHAHEQIVRADEELAGLSERLAKMERDAARPPSAIPGPQSPRPQPPPRRPVLRGLVGLLLAACIIAAALVLQSSYGGETKLVVARWAPLVSTPSLPPENAPLPAPPAPSIVQVAAAEAAPPPATPLAQTAPQDAAPTATAALVDQTQLLQKMARDLANLEQNIEQLKANQQQIASDNSKAIEELKASQEEIKRVLAKVSEPSLSKASSPPTPPASTPPTPTVRKPERTLQSPYARARPRILRGWSYDDDW
jgi:hypothetical protein